MELWIYLLHEGDVNIQLDYFQIIFSSLYEEKCPFTRDYNLIKSELQNLGDYDKTCIEAAFHGVNNMVLTEWGSNTACDVGIYLEYKI